jgi:Domain of unknown function (DUF4360)
MRLKLASAGSAALVALAAALALSTGTAHAATSVDSSVPPAGQVTLRVLSINGSGCAAGTATVTMLSDNTGFRVRYSDFRAQASGGSAPTDFRKNCQIGIQVDIPSGFTFAIARADYRGRAWLASGASALLRTNYYFQGSPGNNYVDHTFAGPLAGGWSASDVTDASAIVYEPCGASAVLNVNSELRVDAASSSALNWIAMGASSGNVDTLVNFQWQQC